MTTLPRSEAGQLPDDLDSPLEVREPTPLTIFGFELTPVRIGLLIGGSGLLVAAIVGFTQIKPTLEQIQKTEKKLLTLPLNWMMSTSK